MKTVARSYYWKIFITKIFWTHNILSIEHGQKRKTIEVNEIMKTFNEKRISFICNTMAK
jgi:hypothetical protein